MSNDERKLAWNFGQSLDSKKITSALGYLDLKQICYCLAQALNKHIEFSRGYFFLDDLKKQAKMVNEVVGDQVEFSYNFNEGLKIDVEAAKQKQAEREQKEKERQREFDKLKLQMETSLGSSVQIKTPQLSNTKFES